MTTVQKSPSCCNITNIFTPKMSLQSIYNSKECLTQAALFGMLIILLKKVLQNHIASKYPKVLVVSLQNVILINQKILCEHSFQLI